MKVKCVICKKCYEVLNKIYNQNLKRDGTRSHNYVCSKKCKDKLLYTGKFVKCGNCNKKIYKTLSTLQKSKSGKNFCDQSCSASYWNKILKNKGGTYRQIAFNAVRKIECALCGYSIKRVLQVHHIDKNRKNRNIKNLIILCPTCHREVHLGVTALK